MGKTTNQKINLVNPRLCFTHIYFSLIAHIAAAWLSYYFQVWLPGNTVDRHMTGTAYDVGSFYFASTVEPPSA